jgi:protoheme IX farnesyltransferase
MLPVVEADGKRTGRQIVAFTLLLVPVSLLPAVLDLAGGIYLCGALLLGLLFLHAGVRAAVEKSARQARRLLMVSVLYLPALFALMVADKRL